MRRTKQAVQAFQAWVLLQILTFRLNFLRWYYYYYYLVEGILNELTQRCNMLCTQNFILKKYNKNMDKYKLKPIEHKQIKKKEVRPTTPASLLAYPPDIKLRILPNMCKSAISSQLFESISTLTKWVKTQKPLTLKPTKQYPLYYLIFNRKVGKIVDSVEQYLSSIDIAALDKSMPLVDTIEDLIYLLGAKDEKEAIGSLYQVVALLETLINRLVQVALISMLNCNRNNPELMAGMNNVGEKPVTQYFESGATAVCELANLLGKVAVIKAKSKGKEELSARVEHSKKIEPTADIEKLKKLEETNKALANELEELKSKLIEERKAFENKEEELKKAIKDLQEEEMKKTLELNTLEKHVTLSVESIQPIDIEVQQLKKEKSKTKVDLVKLESEIRKFYEEEHDKEINSLNEKIAALMMTVPFYTEKKIAGQREGEF
eukprot:TRINITY_DN71079_c0_g1_i1.p1 TRINITY_DN71079_c0_g1~~TRINITY_DN71079_c0_g1_i1.p1  ORF type:complete len:434 (+),score=56.78 TRINITY_DN71079_c0_g1_i1:2784-4085(+)